MSAISILLSLSIQFVKFLQLQLLPTHMGNDKITISMNDYFDIYSYFNSQFLDPIHTIIYHTLEPHYNTDVGVQKSVLYQNSVIMRAFYTGSINSGSQALTVL